MPSKSAKKSMKQKQSRVSPKQPSPSPSPPIPPISSSKMSPATATAGLPAATAAPAVSVASAAPVAAAAAVSTAPVAASPPRSPSSSASSSSSSSSASGHSILSLLMGSSGSAAAPSVLATSTVDSTGVVVAPVEPSPVLVPRDVPPGSVVTIVLGNDRFEGIVHSIDYNLGFVSIDAIGNAPGSYSIFSFAGISSFQVLRRVSQPPPPFVHDATAIAQRAERLIRQRKDEAALIGAGVTREGQAIFDALLKIISCEWKGKAIRIKETIIQPPYTVNDVSGDLEQQVQQVRKMLDVARRNMKLS